ncbi:MAG: hypothetical protein ACLP8X_06695 [Streptosporangiaceae bacterium]
MPWPPRAARSRSPPPRDGIYRDLVHDPDAPFPSPAVISPERTVITTGLSKNLALGGWRLGVTRLPAGGLGRELRARFPRITRDG